MNWYLAVWKNYATFSGRARRSEYWYFALFQSLTLFVLALLGVLAYAVSHGLGMAVFLMLGLFGMASILPSLAVTVRRFHDTGRSGWLLLLLAATGCIPYLGLIANIIQLVFTCQDSHPGHNQYGPSPKYPDALTSAGFQAGAATAYFHAEQPAIPMRYCQQCGAALVEGSTACGQCGAQLGH